MEQPTKKIELRMINVPESMNSIKSTKFFVEARAELYFWENEEPKFLVEYNHLDAIVASAIDFVKLSELVNELFTQIFKDGKDGK